MKCDQNGPAANSSVTGATNNKIEQPRGGFKRLAQKYYRPPTEATTTILFFCNNRISHLTMVATTPTYLLPILLASLWMHPGSLDPSIGGQIAHLKRPNITTDSFELVGVLALLFVLLIGLTGLILFLQDALHGMTVGIFCLKATHGGTIFDR